MTAARTARYEKIAALLASRSDFELVELMGPGRVTSVGVGGESGILDVDGLPVFTKRIPLSDREIANMGSTANLFDLPMFCQYGMGGPGFNAWRELAANITVTDAVVAGETESFPMLHHWRVLPGRPPISAEHADVESVVTAQCGSPAVRTRLEALAAATCSLVLFCEYIPHPMADLLGDGSAGKAVAVERQLSEIVTFLRDRELLHMDGHFGNMRTDMKQIYLSDFGLATSPHFELSAAERDFVERHVAHDAGYAAMRLVDWLVTDVCGIPASPSAGSMGAREYIVQCATGRIPGDVPPTIATILGRHAPAAARMSAFYRRLFDGDFHAQCPAT